MKIIQKIKALFNPPLTEDEEKVKQVIELMLANPDTKFRISPLTNSVLLKQKEAEFFILIEGSKIRISNHAFSFHSDYRLSFIELIRGSVYSKIESDRQEAIKEIFKNEQGLLDVMINKLSYAK